MTLEEYQQDERCACGHGAMVHAAALNPMSMHVSLLECCHVQGGKKCECARYEQGCDKMAQPSDTLAQVT